MRIALPGYDVSCLDSNNDNTLASKKNAEFQAFLKENGIKGRIVFLDEKGQDVWMHTDTGSVVLDIDDSISPENLEKIKKMVVELLKIMGATEAQLASIFNYERLDEDILINEKLSNIVNGLSKREQDELFYMLKRKKEKPFEELLDGLDEDNCCDRLLEAFKLFSGGKVIRDPNRGVHVINHGLFMDSDIKLRDSEHQIYHLDKLTADDILVSVYVDHNYKYFTLSQIEDKAEPLQGNAGSSADEEARRSAKRDIIEFLTDTLNVANYIG